MDEKMDQAPEGMPQVPAHEATNTKKLYKNKKIITAVVIVLVMIAGALLVQLTMRPKKTNAPNEIAVSTASNTVSPAAPIAAKPAFDYAHDATDPLLAELQKAVNAMDDFGVSALASMDTLILNYPAPEAPYISGVYLNPWESYGLGIQAKDYVFNGSKTDTSLSPVKALVIQFLASKGFTNLNLTPQSGGKGIFMGDKTKVCQIDLDKGLGHVMCATLAYINERIDLSKQLYAALQEKDTSQTLSIVTDEEQSKTPGYMTATASVGDEGGNAAGYFYKKDGNKWTYFTATQEELGCSQFNTADLRAAFKGESCVAANNMQETVQ